MLGRSRVDAPKLPTRAFTGFRAFDANGRDVSASVQLSLAGANLAIAPVAPAVVTPEPGTWLLVASGLLAVGHVARRRRRRAR